MVSKIKFSLSANVKRYLVSSAITFFGGFALAVYPYLGQITLEEVTTGAWVGIVFVGVRAGVKLVVEMFIAFYKDYKKK